MDIHSFISSIEQQEEVKSATRVLQYLERKGLQQPAIASGWIRGWLTQTTPTDIDIAYVGDVPFEQAQRYLMEGIQELGIQDGDWDIYGIWNAQQEYPEIATTERNYLIFYVNSIDSVYLSADGKLHDPTGYGFEDAQKRILRMNDFTEMNFSYSNEKVVYLCLEGCRRIAKLKWHPTNRSEDLIHSGVQNWHKLSEKSKDYFFKRIHKKYREDEFAEMQRIYAQYGWGFVFDELRNQSG